MRRLAIATLLVLLAASRVGAQVPAPSSASTAQLSGTLFPYFRYGGAAGQRSDSRFDVERAYLTVRGALGSAMSYRLTADIFQQADTARAGFYRGWALRAKYAYLQYEALRGDSTPLGLTGFARLGILNTVIIDQVDEFWPRWISKTAIDRHGFMSSADAGAAIALESSGGYVELYATATNGEGYQRGEVDRFKDYAARLSIRPFAGHEGWLGGLMLSPWGSIGSRASAFASGPGTVDPVPRGLSRDLWGTFAGYRSSALTLGAEFAARHDETEQADTLVDVRPTFGGRTNRIVSGFLVAKPLALLDSASHAPLGIILRWDRLTSSGAPSGHGNLLIGGATWDFGSRAAIAVDYQEESRYDGYSGPDTRTWFLHAVARF